MIISIIFCPDSNAERNVVVLFISSENFDKYRFEIRLTELRSESIFVRKGSIVAYRFQLKFLLPPERSTYNGCPPYGPKYICFFFSNRMLT